MQPTFLAWRWEDRKTRRAAASPTRAAPYAAALLVTLDGSSGGAELTLLVPPGVSEVTRRWVS